MDGFIEKVNRLANEEYERLKKDCSTWNELKSGIDMYYRNISWQNEYLGKYVYKTHMQRYEKETGGIPIWIST